MLKPTLSLCLLTFALAAQQPPAPPAFPSVPLPIGIAVFGAFNQLGSPRWTGGVSAIYPVAGQYGVYGTTSTDLMPRLAVDPATGRSFYAISAGVRQGFHKSLLDWGRWSFLTGGDIGPSFSQGSPSGISVSLSGSFTVSAVYQITPVLSAMLPVRMLYVAGIGWNPVLEAGLIVNLGKR